MKLYVYGVTEPGTEVGGVEGIEGEEVSTLEHSGLVAVVSECSKVEYDPVEEHVRNHENVVKRVMEEGTVVPMSFGMAKSPRLPVLRAGSSATG